MIFRSFLMENKTKIMIKKKTAAPSVITASSNNELRFTHWNQTLYEAKQMEPVIRCESRNGDIEIPDPLNRVRFMGIDFGVASSLDLLPKSIIHTCRFPSQWRYREFYPWVNVCVSISSAAPFLLDRGRCVCPCSWGFIWQHFPMFTSYSNYW